jgi:hypothetical protein
VLDKVRLDVKTKFHLFDLLVVPIHLYGSEIWGVYNYKDVEKIHIRFCKLVLGVKKQTPNLAIYGELGRFPLFVLAKERAVKFWLKIKKSQYSPIYKSYVDQLALNANNWSNSMVETINNLGFPGLHDNFNDQVNYYPILKQRIRDQFIQSWMEGIHNLPKLEIYSRYNKTFNFEEYFSFVKNEKLRKIFTRFRLSSHTLNIETGRYQRLERNERTCKLCPQNVLESEYHFLLCCNRYTDLRRKYIGITSWPSLNKFIAILSSKNKRRIISLCKYLDEAFQVRLHTLQDL